MKRLLALLLFVPALCFGQAPEPLIVDSQSQTLTRKTVYQWEGKKYRVYFKDGGEATDLTALNPHVGWSTNRYVQGWYPATVTIIDASNGIVDATFPSTSFFTPSVSDGFVYGAWVGTGPTVYQQAALTVLPSPFTGGSNFPAPSVIPIDCNLYSFLNQPWISVAGTAFTANSNNFAAANYFNAGLYLYHTNIFNLFDSAGTANALITNEAAIRSGADSGLSNLATGLQGQITTNQVAFTNWLSTNTYSKIDTALGLQVVTNVITNLVVTGTLTPDATGVYGYMGQSIDNPLPYYARTDNAFYVEPAGATKYYISHQYPEPFAWEWEHTNANPAGLYAPGSGVTGTATVVFQVLTNYMLAYASQTPGVVTNAMQSGSAVPQTNGTLYLSAGVSASITNNCLTNAYAGGVAGVVTGQTIYLPAASAGNTNTFVNTNDNRNLYLTGIITCTNNIKAYANIWGNSADSYPDWDVGNIAMGNGGRASQNAIVVGSSAEAHQCSAAFGYSVYAKNFSLAFGHQCDNDGISDGRCFAGGEKAHASNDYSFVWSDGTAASYGSHGAYTFNALSSAGFWFDGGVIHGNGSGLTNLTGAVYSSCLSNSVSGSNNICITTNCQEIVLTGAATCYWPSGNPTFVGTIYQQWIVGTNSYSITGDVSFAANFALTNSGKTATVANKMFGDTTWHMMVIP